MRRAGLTGLATPASSGRSTSGLDLGSDRSLPIEAVQIAVLTGDGISPTSYGQIWYLLERGIAIPFDALPVDGLSARQLARYDVLVAPAGRASVFDRRRDLLATTVDCDDNDPGWGPVAHSWRSVRRHAGPPARSPISPSEKRTAPPSPMPSDSAALSAPGGRGEASGGRMP